jgi:S-formylglutathione hydrolase FrmB
MWTEEAIGGKKVDVFQPAGRPRFAVLFLHAEDEQTLRQRGDYTRLLESQRLACLCPHGDQSWWVDRVCPSFDPARSPEKFLLDEVLPALQSRWQLAPRSVGLLGIGMGGQAALRLAFRQPRLFPVTAGIAPALDFHEVYGQGTPLDDMYDSREQCRQDTALLHIHPSEQPAHIFFACDSADELWYRGADRLHEKLNALGVEHVADLNTSTGGDRDVYLAQLADTAIRFLVDGLEKESRRLL